MRFLFRFLRFYLDSFKISFGALVKIWICTKIRERKPWKLYFMYYGASNLSLDRWMFILFA